MRTLRYSAVAVFTIIISSLLFSSIVSAAEEKAPEVMRIAIVDADSILRDATVVKGIREQILDYRKKYENEFKKEEEALRTANEDLAKKRTILSPEAFAEERRKFERKVVDVQRLVQVRKQDLDKAQGVAMSKVEEALNQIINEIVTEHKLSIIMKSNQTVYYTRSIDVTQAVLDRLNKKLPSIKVPAPGK